MRDAIERQRRERKLAAVIFVVLLGVTALGEGWRIARATATLDPPSVSSQSESR
jgi:hypothetical protein